MNFYDVIKARRSIRYYKPTPVPQEALDRIWEAVRLAPSACNQQPWEFLIVQSPEMRAALQKLLHQTWAFSAPIIIVGFGNRRLAWQRDSESTHPIDVAIATEHLVLAAAAEGLGTCWICDFDRNAVRQALGQGPEWDPIVVVPLGYANDATPRPPRKPLEEVGRIV